MTPLERWPGDPPFLTKERAAALVQAESERRNKANEPSAADRPAPPVGGDTTPAKSFFEALEKAGGGAVGGYNNFWLNQGSAYTEVGGQIRTSIVVDPPDGMCRPSLKPRAGGLRRRGRTLRQRLRNARMAPPSRLAPTITRSSGP